MNTNRTNTNTNKHMKERIMNTMHSMKNGIIETFMNEKKFDVFATVNICFFVAIVLILAFAGKSMIDGLLVCVAVWRILYYFINTKKSGRKRSFKDFFKATYTEDDFDELRQDISKEMKIKANAEISTEKEELEKERAKMKEFLRKHNTGGVVFSQFEKDMFADVALYVGICFSDYMWEYTLEDFVNFFNGSKEDFIKNIQDEAFRGCMLNDMTKSLTFYCLNKKALRELRKKLRDAYGNSDKCKKIVICDDYRKNEQGFTERFVQPGHILDGYNI